MSNRMLVGVKPKTNVLLDGIPHIAGEAVGDGRTYVDLKTGDERFLTGSQQRDMVAEFRLVLDDLPGDFVDHIARARQASFKVFSFVDRTVALRRLRYVRAVHALPERVRHRKEYIEKAIPIVFEELRKDGLVTTLVPDPPENDGEELEQPTLATAIRDKLMQRIERDMETDEAQPPPDQKAPTPRTVRRLYRLYFASGQDIRVLLPLHCLKGHRGPRYLEWVNVAIDKVIDEAVLCPTPTTYADALKIACDKVTKPRPAARCRPSRSSGAEIGFSARTSSAGWSAKSASSKSPIVSSASRKRDAAFPRSNLAGEIRQRALGGRPYATRRIRHRPAKRKGLAHGSPQSSTATADASSVSRSASLHLHG